MGTSTNHTGPFAPTSAAAAAAAAGSARTAPGRRRLLRRAWHPPPAPPEAAGLGSGSPGGRGCFQHATAACTTGCNDAPYNDCPQMLWRHTPRRCDWEGQHGRTVAIWGWVRCVTKRPVSSSTTIQRRSKGRPVWVTASHCDLLSNGYNTPAACAHPLWLCAIAAPFGAAAVGVRRCAAATRVRTLRRDLCFADADASAALRGEERARVMDAVRSKACHSQAEACRAPSTPGQLAQRRWAGNWRRAHAPQRETQCSRSPTLDPLQIHRTYATLIG